MKLFVFDKYSIIILALILVFTACMIPIGMSGAVSTAGKTTKEVPIYAVKTEEKKIADTFDCAWNADDIDQVIEVLAQNNCKATYFVGDWTDKFPEAVKKLADAGHEIANHSDKHDHFNQLSKEQMIADMTKCDEKIKALTGQQEVLFRAPYGEYNDTLVTTCRETGRFIIQWDVDSLDWKELTADQMEKRIMDRVKNGSILLFHNGTKNTAGALGQILGKLTQHGYSFVTVSDLIYKDNYYLDNAGLQIQK